MMHRNLLPSIVSVFLACSIGCICFASWAESNLSPSHKQAPTTRIFQKPTPQSIESQLARVETEIFVAKLQSGILRAKITKNASIVVPPIVLVSAGGGGFAIIGLLVSAAACFKLFGGSCDQPGITVGLVFLVAGGIALVGGFVWYAVASSIVNSLIVQDSEYLKLERKQKELQEKRIYLRELLYRSER